jgi:hypothetical protein
MSTEPKTSSFESLFDNLSHIIDVSRKKFDYERASNSDKQKWGRLMIQGIEALAKIRETAKIEAVEQRIAALESNQTPLIEFQPFRESILDKLRRESSERKKTAISNQTNEPNEQYEVIQ